MPDKIKKDINELAKLYNLQIIDLTNNANIDYYCPPQVNFCI